MKHLGDFDASAVLYGKFTTFRPSTGAPFTLAGTPAISVYKDNSTTQSTAGVTLTADFDSVTGLNHFAIDTSADGTFYAAGSFFDIVITTGTVDSVSVVGSVVASFTIRKTSALKPTTAGRMLDVSAGGEAGVDWANIGSPTTSVNLSGTTVKTATDVETDTADIQTRLPAALVSGRMDSSVGAMAANVLTATAINADAFTAAKFAADVTTELQNGLATASALSTVEGKIDTVDTVVDAILVDTAEIGAAGAGLTALASAANLATVDTVVDAIKAKTDNLPSDPADASDVATAFAATDAGVAALQADVTVIREYADNTVCRGTVSGTSPTTTSFTSSALDPAGAAADQFKGRIIVFDKDTTTAELRGQATDITANTSASNPLFTFTALTTAPQSGDTFSIT